LVSSTGVFMHFTNKLIWKEKIISCFSNSLCSITYFDCATILKLFHNSGEKCRHLSMVWKFSIVTFKQNLENILKIPIQSPVDEHNNKSQFSEVDSS